MMSKETKTQFNLNVSWWLIEALCAPQGEPGESGPPGIGGEPGKKVSVLKHQQPVSFTDWSAVPVS